MATVCLQTIYTLQTILCPKHFSFVLKTNSQQNVDRKLLLLERPRRNKISRVPTRPWRQWNLRSLRHRRWRWLGDGFGSESRHHAVRKWKPGFRLDCLQHADRVHVQVNEHSRVWVFLLQFHILIFKFSSFHLKYQVFTKNFIFSLQNFDSFFAILNLHRKLVTSLVFKFSSFL